MRRVALLGSTGSIGTQSLDVLQKLCHEFEVVALAAGTQDALLLEQVNAFRPKYVALADVSKQKEFEKSLPAGTRFVGGEDALCQIAGMPDVDDVLVSVVGAMGLDAVLAAANHGKRVLLANKEALVCGGELVMSAIQNGGGALLPIDSEHSAIFQCMQGQQPPRKIILTASGGPFRTWDMARMKNATFADCLKHPTWDMGWKITLDSATLMNKGLEIIEARWLFDMPEHDIDVVVHPQSILHSAVVFSDGSVIGQMGWPSMKLPIQYALTYPKRATPTEKPLDLVSLGRMDFEAPDENRFPCLRLARESLRLGGLYSCIFNAAGESASHMFKAGQIGFLDIPKVIESVMQKAPSFDAGLQGVRQADVWARQQAFAFKS